MPPTPNQPIESASESIPTQPIDFRWFIETLERWKGDLQKHMDERFDGLDERLRAVEQGETGCRANLEGRIKALEDRDDDQDRRLDNLESSRNTWNIFNSIGVAIAGLIAILKGN